MTTRDRSSTRLAPPPPVNPAPGYEGGGACAWCYRCVPPSFFLFNRKAITVRGVDGDLRFCDWQCLDLWRSRGPRRAMDGSEGFWPPEYAIGCGCNWCGWEVDSRHIFSHAVTFYGEHETLHFCDEECLHLWRNYDHEVQRSRR